MKGKGEPRAGGAGGHSILTFNHRQAAALGCQQNKSDRCGLLKSNIIGGDYHTERHGESSAQRETYEEFGCSAKRRLVLFEPRWHSIPRLTLPGIAARCPLRAHTAPQSQGRVSIGEGNEADRRLMLLGKTLRIFG